MHSAVRLLTACSLIDHLHQINNRPWPYRVHVCRFSSRAVVTSETITGNVSHGKNVSLSWLQGGKAQNKMSNKNALNEWIRIKRYLLLPSWCQVLSHCNQFSCIYQRPVLEFCKFNVFEMFKVFEIVSSFVSDRPVSCCLPKANIRLTTQCSIWDDAWKSQRILKKCHGHRHM